MLSRRHFICGAATGLAVAGASTVPARAFTVAPIFEPQRVAMRSAIPVGQIVVLPRAHFLYFIDAPGEAMRYGVGVGRAGLEFTGTAVIGAKKKWPTWRPTNEMIARDPHLYPDFIDDEDYVQPGGPGNPLGARALYLYENGVDTFFRIHGTTQPSSIGRSVSSGCIRMLNEHVTDLYERVPIGTTVTVL